MDYVETMQYGASEFSAPFVEMYSQVLGFLPELLASLFVLVLGLIVSPLVGRAVTKLLQIAHVDKGMDISGAKDALASIGLHFTLSRLLGTIVQYLTLIVFITIASDLLGLGQLTRLINELLLFIPNIIIALVIFGIGLTVADWLRDMVENMSRASDNADYAELLGNTTRIAVIVFAVMAALSQVGVASVLIQIIFAGVVFALALAFGLGAKDTVARAIAGWVQK